MASIQNTRAIFAKLKTLREDASKTQDLIDLLNQETDLDIDDDSLTSSDIENLMKILEQNTSIKKLSFYFIYIDRFEFKREQNEYSRNG